MLDKGITAITDVWTFVEGNDTLATVIGVAVAFIVVGGLLGLFFRRG